MLHLLEKLLNKDRSSQLSTYEQQDTSFNGTAGPWDCTWEPPGLLSALLCCQTRIIFSTDLNHTIQAFRVCDKKLNRRNRTTHSACVFKTSMILYEIYAQKDWHAGCYWLLMICNGSVEERFYRTLMNAGGSKSTGKEPLPGKWVKQG